MLRVAKSRNQSLAPIPKAIAGVCTSFVIFWALRQLRPLQKLKVPEIVLVVMLMSSLQFAKLFTYVKPTMSLERQHLIDALAALDNYVRESRSVIDRKHALYSKMPLRHRKSADQVGYPDRLNKLEAKAEKNGILLQDISNFAKGQFSVSTHEMRFANSLPNSRVVELIDHLVRDWSVENEVNRRQLFEPILNSLRSYLPVNSKNPSPSILIPGAGLGRLSLECAKLGYKTESLEISTLMDITTRFIMAIQQRKLDENARKCYQLHPYIHEFSHQISSQAQLKEVTIPDTIHEPLPLVTTTLGDFTKIESQTQYDAVITLFLLDTAENVFHYLEALERIVRPGGVWINYGPLKWGTAPQVEFNMEELKQVISDSGSWTVKDEFRGSNVYHGNPDSLWEGQYKIRGWSAIRNT